MKKGGSQDNKLPLEQPYNSNFRESPRVLEL